MTTEKYNKKKIERIQKKLCELGVFEEFIDYRISEQYLREFLEHLDKNYGKRDYIIGSQLIPLFDRIKERYPSLTKQEIVNEAHELIPFIRAMFYHQKIISIIRNARKGKVD